MVLGIIPAMPDDRSLLVIVPAWNEEDSVGSVVAELSTALPTADVLVVNDGSTDRTSAVAREAGALVLDLPVNLGVGGAMQSGATSTPFVRAMPGRCNTTPTVNTTPRRSKCCLRRWTIRAPTS